MSAKLLDGELLMRSESHVASSEVGVAVLVVLTGSTAAAVLWVVSIPGRGLPASCALMFALGVEVLALLGVGLAIRVLNPDMTGRGTWLGAVISAATALAVLSVATFTSLPLQARFEVSQPALEKLAHDPSGQRRTCVPLYCVRRIVESGDRTYMTVTGPSARLAALDDLATVFTIAGFYKGPPPTTDDPYFPSSVVRFEHLSGDWYAWSAA